MINFDFKMLSFSGLLFASLVVLFFFPLAGLILLIFSFPLPLDKVSWLYPCDIAFIVVLASSIFRITFKRVKSFAGKEMLLFFIPFFIALIISAARAPESFKFKGQLYLWLQIPLTYIIVVNLIKSSRQLQLVIYSMIASGTILAVFYISCQYPFNFFFDEIYNLQHSFTASSLGLYLFLILGSLAANKEKKDRKILIIWMTVVFIALLVTTSRWAIASFLFSVFVFVNLICKKDQIRMNSYLFFLISGSSIFFILIYFFAPDFFNNFDLRIRSVYFRLGIYRSVFVFIKQNPLTGIGLGYFHHYTYFAHAHNIFLHILVETGLIGLGTFIFFILAMAKHFAKKVKNYASENKHMFYAVTGCLLFFGLHNLFDFTLDRGMGMQLGILLAIMDLSLSSSKSKGRENQIT